MKIRILLTALLASLIMACTPTVKVAMPNEPININLNAKIEHQISIKVDKALDDLFDKNDDLF